MLFWIAARTARRVPAVWLASGSTENPRDPLQHGVGTSPQATVAVRRERAGP